MKRTKINLDTKEEVERLIKSLEDIIKRYAVVSLADLHDLVGLPSYKAEEKLGWTKLDDNGISILRIWEVKKGYVLEFPMLEEI